MALTKKEKTQINELIKSYKNTIKFIRRQIAELERKKLPNGKANLKVAKKEKKNEINKH